MKSTSTAPMSGDAMAAAGSSHPSSAMSRGPTTGNPRKQTIGGRSTSERVEASLLRFPSPTKKRVKVDKVKVDRAINKSPRKIKNLNSNKYNNRKEIIKVGGAARQSWSTSMK